MQNNGKSGSGTVTWRTPFDENIVAVFRRAAGTFFLLSFIILPVMIRLLNFKFLDSGLGVAIWLLAPVPIGLWWGRSRTYAFDPVTMELAGPGFTPAVKVAGVASWEVPAEEKDVIVGFGLQLIWAWMVVGFFSSPIFKGEYILHMRDGSKKSLMFARHDTALSFFYWMKAQDDIACGRG